MVFIDGHAAGKVLTAPYRDMVDMVKPAEVPPLRVWESAGLQGHPRHVVRPAGATRYFCYLHDLDKTIGLYSCDPIYVRRMYGV